jgi:hypothetical protein
MKKFNSMLLVLTIFIIFSSTIHSEEIEMIKSAKMKLEAAGGELTINKFFAGNEICVEIIDETGKKLLEMHGIGTQEKLFSLRGKATGLAVADVTGDGVEEVLASAFYGPASALYVFKFDEAGKKFAPIKFADSDDAYLHREYMVSDLPATDGTDMRIDDELNLIARGKIFPSSAEESVKTGEYHFKFIDKVFKLIEIKELK